MSFCFRQKLMRCGASLLLGALSAMSAPAVAGSLTVDPIMVEIDQQHLTATVTIHNVDQAPVTIHAYALGWTQRGGEDVYDDEAPVIVSPPVFTIPAGGAQLVRVGMRRAGGEPHAYRLMIEEVPEATPGTGIRVAIRLNLPLYTMMSPGAASDIAWSAWQDGDRRWVLEAANSGAGYVRVDPGQARAATGVAGLDSMFFGVVLPGSARQWTIGVDPDVEDRGRFESVARPGRGDDAQFARRTD